jgi:hypothetical protein
MRLTNVVPTVASMPRTPSRLAQQMRSNPALRAHT